jgi:oligoribonuclease NrnB/cAMP/cGMP phosphodiesterase (DHH superfamily)
MIKEFVTNSEGLNNLHVIFDMNRAGCQIAWDYFHYNLENNTPDIRPWFLDYIADGDLWFPSESQEPNPLPNCRAVLKGLQECGYLTKIAKLNTLYKESGDSMDLAQVNNKKDLMEKELIPVGQRIIDSCNRIISYLVKKSWLVEYSCESGVIYYGWMVNNTNYIITSDLGHQMLHKPIILTTQSTDKPDSPPIHHYPGASIDNLHTDQANTYIHTRTNSPASNANVVTEQLMPAFSINIRGYDPITKSVLLSLRGGESHSPNVAKICARFGGGGHPAAAGVTISLEDFHKYFRVIEHSS